MIISFVLLSTLSITFLYGLKLLSKGVRAGLLLVVCSIFSGILVIFPDIAGAFANLLGVGRGADLLLYLSFVIGLILLLLMHIKLKNIESSITELARYIALNEQSK